MSEDSKEVTIFNLGIDFEIKDVISIANNKIEDLLTEQYETAKDEETKLRNELRDLNTKFNEWLVKKAKNLVDGKMQGLKKTLSEFSRDLEGPYYGHVIHPSQTVYRNNYDHHLWATDDLKNEFSVTISIYNEDDIDSTVGLELDHSFKLKDKEFQEYLDKLNELNILSEKVNKNHYVIKNLKHKLENIPKLEKRWKAMLAENELKKAKGGEEIVEMLNNNISKLIEKMPDLKL